MLILVLLIVGVLVVVVGFSWGRTVVEIREHGKDRRLAEEAGNEDRRTRGR